MKVLRVGSGRVWVQNMGPFDDGDWSGDHQLIWTQGKKGDSVEIEFSATDGGKQELIVVLSKAKDYGIVQLAVDGKDIGKPIDCYDDTVTTTGEIPLGTLDLKTGKHVLRATAVGCNDKTVNAHSGSHVFGIDYLRLVKQAGRP